MPCRAAIFDLDGTLLDTLEDLADSANHMLTVKGYPVHPLESYKHHVGDGVRVLMERILPESERDEATIAQCMDLYRQAYSERWNAKTRPYPGIEELLDGLATRGLKLAVLSNKPHAFTLQCIGELTGVCFSAPPVHESPDGVGWRGFNTLGGFGVANQIDLDLPRSLEPCDDLTSIGFIHT